MTYALKKLVLLDDKNKNINSKKEKAEKYEPDIAKKERSYIVQEDKDELSIVKINKNYINIEEKEALIEQYRQIRKETQNI
ncbi:5002_t:CDS:1, partial [Gigaspora margarita]